MANTSNPAYVLGVGMTKFVKPRGKIDYTELGYEAGIKALLDAHINYDDIDQGIACYCYGDSTCGNRVFYQFGMTGIPIYNVNNNCSTGSTGLNLARTMIQGGLANAVMVVGFEKMERGSLKSKWEDRANPTGTSGQMMAETRGVTNAPGAAQLFGNAGIEYMEKYGATPSDFAEIARINHSHSSRNPYSQFRDTYTLDQILASPPIFGPLTKLQCCPTSDGGASAIIVSQSFLDARPHLKSQAILIAGQSLTTDSPSLFDKSSISLVGFGMTQRAAAEAYAQANVTPKDIHLVELHDCFSANQLLTLDALGLCPPGEAHLLVRSGALTYDASNSNSNSNSHSISISSREPGPNPQTPATKKVITNPSGGLISKGHPLGATGLAQCCELTWHLRGWANNRLVYPIGVALQHNLGLGGAVVVTLYKRADGGVNGVVGDEEVAERSGVGYNPAVEARGFTEMMAEGVRSRVAGSGWALGEVGGRVLGRF